MCCYATKIFLCLLTALLLAGLVLGFGLARRTLWGAQKAQPLYGGDPLLPATTPPSTELAVASSTAEPPATASVPVFGPPSPFPVAAGPGPSSRP